MKINKNEMSAIEKLVVNVQFALKQYHHESLSNNAKRAWKERRVLSTRYVKHCKV